MALWGAVGSGRHGWFLVVGSLSIFTFNVPIIFLDPMKILCVA